MAEDLEADICVIGAGSGGLVAAVGAAQFGVKVILIERARMGGDCLNVGCVPSKSLLAAAKHAHAMRTGHPFGIQPVEPRIDHAAVSNHVAGVIQAIAPNDSVERMTGLGIRVIQGSPGFTSQNTVAVADYQVKARYFVVATGSSPAVPPIPGLDKVACFTNETVFDLTEVPAQLIVVGGGPIGLELAQAHRRLGSRVSVIEAAAILPKDDPEAAAVVRERLHAEGIEVIEQATVHAVAKEGNGVSVDIETNAGPRRLAGTHILIAAGRRANVQGLNLEAAGIEASPQGIKVDMRLRTTNKRVFAIGDVAGGYQFTHVAGYHAGIVIRNALFNLPAKADHSAVPWVTYTDPELAHVGLTEAEAKSKDATAIALRWPFAENDRAQAERATEGFVKAIVAKDGRIVGATIVGRHAGELILPWVLAVKKRLTVGDMATIIAPYPTLSEVSKRVAGSWYTPQLFSARTRRLVRLMQHLP